MSKADDLQDFADRLSRIMGQLNFSRAALARELAVDKTVVRRWLAGVNAPTEHNLTRLTEIVRRHRADFTLSHWRGDAQDFVAVASGVAVRAVPQPQPAAQPVPPPLARPRLVGLRQPVPADRGRPYVGLWSGFFLSMANRGLLLACAMRIAMDGDHLNCDFSEGNFTGVGPALPIGRHLHIIIEAEPIYERLGFVTFTSVQAPMARIIDGVVMVPAADTTATPSAGPMLMCRLDDGVDAPATPSITELAPAISDLNRRVAAAASASGEPWAFWTDQVPASILDLMRVRVGTRRDDGEFDHILRMPASRSPALPELVFAALPADAPERLTVLALRRLLRLD